MNCNPLISSIYFVFLYTVQNMEVRKYSMTLFENTGFMEQWGIISLSR